ncbi:MAG: LuxR C-terminal-related transcriptional regulator, partial [Actinomycetota bacterium]|nr:LuxR C-terminal-related transcriptional regulator [Actinomycetota bacterium]
PDDPEVEAGVSGRCGALFHVRNGNWIATRVALDDAVAVLRRHDDLWFPLFGLWALLHAVDGIDGQAAVDEAESRPGADIAFNRVRILLARAVLAGRSGDSTYADELVGRAEAVAPGPPGARVWTSVERVLVAPAAAADGWGNPVEWARQALALFEDCRLPELAGAARKFLRAAGQPVPRRGRGDTAVPSVLAAVGVTTREADVLRLLAGRLSNRAIGERLHLSPRTVERHIANLLLKVDAADRYALADEARRSGLVASDD